MKVFDYIIIVISLISIFSIHVLTYGDILCIGLIGFALIYFIFKYNSLENKIEKKLKHKTKSF